MPRDAKTTSPTRWGPLSTVALLIVGCAFAMRAEDVRALRLGAQGDPVARFEATRIDFGEIPHGEVARSIFRVRNRGTSRLDILGVEVTCGCTLAQVSQRSLAPGEEATLEIAFDSRKKAPTAAPTRYTNHILVRTNAPADPEVTLVLEGAVFTRFRMVPAAGVVLRQTPVVGTIPADERLGFEVYALGADPERLLSMAVRRAPRGVFVDGPRVHVDERGAAGVRFDVRLGEGLEAGPLRGAIELATGDERQPVLTVPVIGTVAPSVRASTTALHLPLGGPPRRVSLTVPRTARREGPPVTLVGVEAREEGGGPPSVELESLDDAGGEAFHTTLVRARAGALTGRGVVRFRVTDPHTPVVDVPYRLLDLSGRQRRVDEAKAALVMVSPPDLELRTYDVGSDQLVRLTLSSIGPGLAISGLHVVGSDLLDVSHEPVRADRVHRLLLRIRAERAGPIDAKIRVRPRPRDPYLEIPVAGRIQARLEAVPAGVYVAPARPTGSFRVRRRDGLSLGDAARLRARSSDPRLAVELVASAGGDEATVRVDATNLPAGPLRATVEVTCGLPGEPRLEVEVFGSR